MMAAPGGRAALDHRLIVATPAGVDRAIVFASSSPFPPPVVELRSNTG